MTTITNLSTLTYLSHNIHKQTPTPFVISHFLRGYEILFLQELQTAPSPPPPFHHSLVVSSIPTTFGRGVAICVHPKLVPFATTITTPDSFGMLAAASLTFPGFPPILLCSLYVPYTSPERDLVASLLAPLLSQYPLHILGGILTHAFPP